MLLGRAASASRQQYSRTPRQTPRAPRPSARILQRVWQVGENSCTRVLYCSLYGALLTLLFSHEARTAGPGRLRDRAPGVDVGALAGWRRRRRSGPVHVQDDGARDGEGGGQGRATRFALLRGSSRDRRWRRIECPEVFVQQTLLSTRAGRQAYYHGRPRVRARQDSMCWVLGATPAQRYGARLHVRLSRTSECSGGESTFGWIAASFRNPKAKGFHGARPKVSDSLFRRAAFTTSSRGARAAGGGVRTCLVFVNYRIELPGLAEP